MEGPVGAGAKRVLVAEDDPLLREFAVDALTDLGYHTVAAADGRDAWQRLSRGAFDLMLLDEAMPHVTGRELLARLRRSGSRIPVLVWSGHAEFTAEERAELGIVGLLRKPVRIEDLERAVRDALEDPPG